MRAAWTTDGTPSYVDTVSKDAWAVMSIPVFSFQVDVTMDEIYYSELIIKMKNPKDHSTIDALSAKLEDEAPGADVNTSYKMSAATVKIK